MTSLTFHHGGHKVFGANNVRARRGRRVRVLPLREHRHPHLQRQAQPTHEKNTQQGGWGGAQAELNEVRESSPHRCSVQRERDVEEGGHGVEELVGRGRSNDTSKQQIHRHMLL